MMAISFINNFGEQKPADVGPKCIKSDARCDRLWCSKI